MDNKFAKGKKGEGNLKSCTSRKQGVMGGPYRWRRTTGENNCVKVSKRDRAGGFPLREKRGAE